jgi:hypothetical protein
VTEDRRNPHVVGGRSVEEERHSNYNVSNGHVKSSTSEMGRLRIQGQLGSGKGVAVWHPCFFLQCNTHKEMDPFTPSRSTQFISKSIFFLERKHHLPTRSFISASKNPSMFSIAFQLQWKVVTNTTRQRIQNIKDTIQITDCHHH